jgi:predicted amidohydrolase YtcJ
MKPDVVFFNGTVATQQVQRPLAGAIAVGGNRILAVGEDADILHLAGPDTQRINLNGRLMVPGFIDTHIHFYEWALKRQGIRLDDVTAIDELLTRVRQAARVHPPGEWITGQGWNETDWAVPQMPTRQFLDRAAPDHPVLLWRCDLHLAAANSTALQLAGIGADTPDPPEGRIERDATGEATGILRELAINRVREAMATPSAGRVMEAFEDATEALYRRGVTGIHDVRLMADGDGADAFGTFQRLDRENRLGLRAWVSLPGDRLDEIVGLGLRTGFGNDRLRVGHVKYFSDGGMGARTAWMIDPYRDADRGMPLMDMDELEDAVGRADAAGLSVMVHAVGDRANREVIDIFARLEATHDGARHTGNAIAHRLEHVQMIRPVDADRLRNLQLALCVTPANMVLDINLIDAAVGEQGKWTYAFRRLIDTGAPVMFSSDCPVCDPDPLVGIHAAATRQRADGTPADGWHAHSRVTVAEAIRAYTAVPAAVHRVPDIGAIAPGNLADLAVLGENILSSPPSRIPDVRVEMTVFDGKVVYREF